VTRDKIMSSPQIAGRVRRWHTWPMIREQTVAAHSARVATLYCELWGLPRAEVLYYCLHHDSGELSSGDVPFSAKDLAPQLREAVNHAEAIGRTRIGVTLPELRDKEFKKFKICDLLEMWETGLVEHCMGNTYAIPVIEDTMAAAESIARDLGEWDTLNRWRAKQ